LTRTIMY